MQQKEKSNDIFDWQATCTKELTVRYDAAVIILKQNLEIVINGQAVSLNRLPLTLGKVRVKQASSSMVMGKTCKFRCKEIHYLNLPA